MLRIREALNDILARHSGQPKDKIQADIERDFIMTPAEAKAYGLIDEIIASRNDAKA